MPRLIAALPAAVRADLAALDIKQQDLSRLEARLYLIHGRDDSIIPYSESVALRAAAPAGAAELYIVNNLAHVDFAPSDMFGLLRLWNATYRLLSERDAMAAPLFPPALPAAGPPSCYDPPTRE